MDNTTKMTIDPDYVKYITALTRPTINYDVSRFDELLEKTAERIPSRIGLVYKGINFSFQTLNNLTNGVARTLKDEIGVKPGTVVALTTALCPESMITYLAISRIGAIVTPINPLHVERGIEYQLKESGAKVSINTASKVKITKKIRDKLPDLETILWYGPPEDGLSAENNLFCMAQKASSAPIADNHFSLDDVVALPFSSGTTGLPKGVMLSHRNLISNAYQFINTHQISDLDVLYNGLPLLINLHIGGGFGSGAKQILIDQFDLIHMLEEAKKYEATSIYTVVPMVNQMGQMENLKDYRIPSLKFIAAGASHLSPAVAQKVYKQLGVKVVQGFGAQETSTMSHALPLPLFEGMEVPSGSCGIATASTEFKLVDILDKTKEVPLGQPGELVVKGPQVMSGYWQNPEKTESAIVDQWFYTGDILKTDEYGIIYFVERERDVIKAGGHTISPTEIEDILKEHSDVKDCAVVGIPVGEDDESPVAFVVSSRDGFNFDDVIRYVNSEIAWYKHIKEIKIVEEIPKSSGGGTGKIKRQQLKESYLEIVRY